MLGLHKLTVDLWINHWMIFLYWWISNVHLLFSKFLCQWKFRTVSFLRPSLKKCFLELPPGGFYTKEGGNFCFVLLKFVKINLSARGISVRQEAIPNKQYLFFLASGVVNLWVDLSCQLSAFWLQLPFCCLTGYWNQHHLHHL